VLLLAGFGMVAGGVAIAVGVDGGMLPGVALAVVGLLVKVAGFMMGDPSSELQPGRRPQTLGGRSVERPRAGIPVGRVAMGRRIPTRAPAGTVRPLAETRRREGVPAPSAQEHRHRRAS
jgi:hypothetical protein